MRKSGKNAISDIRLVFFCGNPGREYAKTRHNAAWMVLEKIAERENLHWQGKFSGFYAKSARLNGLILLKPDVFMNLAGRCLAPAASFFRLSPENIMVCHDDIELAFGTAAVKTGGGAAGHNGLRSIAGMLGTGDFLRLRIGISRPARGGVDSHVLGRFSHDEEIELPLFMQKAADMLEEIVRDKSCVSGAVRLLP